MSKISDIFKLDDEHQQVLVCLYFAKMPSSDDRYKKNRNNYVMIMSNKFNKKFNTYKNYIDAFDAYFPENNRKGWDKDKYTLKKKYSVLQDIFDDYKDLTVDELDKPVKQIIDSFSDNNSFSTTVENNIPYITMKCGLPKTVHELISGKRKNIVVDSVYTLKDALTLNKYVFVTLGGDVNKKDVDWEPGLFGIAHIVKEPYDFGYDKKHSKNFKFDISVDCKFSRPYKREDFMEYVDAFDATYIGPELSRDPSQAICGLNEKKAVAIVRAIIDKQPELKDEMIKLFPEDFIERVLGAIKMFIPKEIKYGDKVDLDELSNIDLLQPEISDNVEKMRMQVKNYWILVSKQENNNGMGFIDTDTYTAPSTNSILFKNAKVGDRFVGYIKGKGIVVEGEITKKNSDTEIEYKKIISYTNPINSEMLIDCLDPNCYARQMNLSGTAFKISKKEYENIISKLNGKNPCDFGFERNRIVFGAPGTGKSFKLQNNADDCKKNCGGQYERVTFHPDYTYSQFVGAYKPVSVKGQIDYKFVPGPFLRVYVDALKNSKTAAVKPFILLIEEINRARVAAVFGDVFQLLDRDGNGESTYSIQTSEDIRNYLAKELNASAEDFTEIRLPNNMFIWATMNSADQGVFPMDTAFKRRWCFEYINIDDAEDKLTDNEIKIGKTNEYYTWNNLRKAINNNLIDNGINEDKLLGPFFLSETTLKNAKDNPDGFNESFKNKVIMYLFEDVMKMRPGKLFNENIKDGMKLIYSDICKKFDSDGINIFNEKIVEELRNSKKKLNNTFNQNGVQTTSTVANNNQGGTSI